MKTPGDFFDFWNLLDEPRKVKLGWYAFPSPVWTGRVEPSLAELCQWRTISRLEPKWACALPLGRLKWHLVVVASQQQPHSYPQPSLNLCLCNKPDREMLFKVFVHLSLSTFIAFPSLLSFFPHVPVCSCRCVLFYCSILYTFSCFMSLIKLLVKPKISLFCCFKIKACK